jgi:molybdopterin synthase catalytic subunit
MKIAVLLFGVLKDLAGRSGETTVREIIDLPEGARVRDVLSYYARKAPRFEAMVPSLAISVNQEYSAADRVLREDDEVGLLPPVSGGIDGEFQGGVQDGVQGGVQNEVRIVREPIDVEAVAGRLKRPPDGAAVIFEGAVRDNSRGRRTLYLDYEAYEAMALRQPRRGLVLRSGECPLSTGWGGWRLGRRAY